MKKVLALVLVLMLALSVAFTATAEETPKVILIAKSYQNMFYQASFQGSDQAGVDFGLDVSNQGPDQETNVSGQVEMIKAAVNQKPAAIILASIDTDACYDALVLAKDQGIPVIGFDSGVPGDQSGAVVATSATNNYTAGAFTAENLFANEEFQAKIAAASEDNKLVVGVLAQDSISGSIVQRVTGFVDKMVELLEGLDGMEGAVEVTGQNVWNKESANPAKINVAITVPPSAIASDIQAAAAQQLNTENMVALFASNQQAVDGLLGATADGTELDRENGRYKDLLVVGFDAGAGQKKAVAAGQMLGAVTQDPYNMGYQAVRLAADILNGETPEDVDTGCKWYDASNIEQEDIAILLYD